MKQMRCFVCTQIVYSEIGEGCKMCGMSLEDKDLDFCCEACEDKYGEINQEKIK